MIIKKLDKLQSIFNYIGDNWIGVTGGSTEIQLETVITAGLFGTGKQLGKTLGKYLTEGIDYFYDKRLDSVIGGGVNIYDVNNSGALAEGKFLRIVGPDGNNVIGGMEPGVPVHEYLHSYWKMDGASNTNELNIIQISGYNLQQINGNLLTSVDGKINKARGNFGLYNYFVWYSGGSPSTVYDRDSYLVEAWIKVTHNGSYQTIVAKQHSSYGWQITITPSKNIMLWQSGWTLESSGVDVADGNWHYIVCAQLATSGANNNRIYIDGINRGQREGYYFSKSDNFLAIGGNGNGGGEYPLNGIIDDVAFWNTMPADWATVETIIAQRYNSGAGAPYSVASGAGIIDQVVAKNLTSWEKPPERVLYIDPKLGRFTGVGGKLIFWSKLESYLTSEEGSYTIETGGTNSYNYSFGDSYGSWPKWNRCLACMGYQSGYGKIITNKNVPSAGVMSVWVGHAPDSGRAGFVYFITDDLTKVSVWYNWRGSQTFWYITINSVNVATLTTTCDSGGPVNYIVAWDAAKTLPGSKSIIVYRNGVELLSTSNSLIEFTLPFSIKWVGEPSYQFNVSFDNIKVWDYIPGNLITNEYNSGTGNETWAGETSGDIKVGYYNVYFGGISIEVPLEDVMIDGYFGNKQRLAKNDNTYLTSGTDFNWDKRLDSTEGGGVNIYDTGISGNLGSGKYIRFVDKKTGKNIKDVTGLGYEQIIAKENLSGEPAEKVVWINPVTGQYKGIGGLVYFSKMESIVNATTAAEYGGAVISGSTYGLDVTPGKWGNGLYFGNYDAINQSLTLNINNGTLSKGSLSCWVKAIWYTSRAIVAFNLLGKQIGIDSNYYGGYQRGYVGDPNGPEVTWGANGTIFSHWYIVWDEAKGLTGGKSIRVWLDGVEVWSTTETLTPIQLNIWMYYSHGYTVIDNLKIWNLPIESPSLEWNGGLGDENRTGGGGADLAVGYYWLRSSSDPAQLNELSSGNTVVELENANSFDGNIGYFGVGRLISKHTYGYIRENIDFYYDEALDGSGEHAIDIYDDENSGAFNTGKYLRVVQNGINVTDPTGLNLKPIAKKLDGDVFIVPPTEIWIDPLRAKFAVSGSIIYWSKCEDEDNLLNPDKSLPYFEVVSQKWGDTGGINLLHDGGKFGHCVYAHQESSDKIDNYFKIKPFGETIRNINKGTLSVWVKNSSINTTNSATACLFFIGNNNSLSVRIGCREQEGHNIKLWINNIVRGTYNILTLVNTWMHLYIVWDKGKSLSGSKSVRVFLNGLEVISSTEDLPDMNIVFENTWWIASADSAFSWIGMDNLKIWNTVYENPSFEYNEGIGNENYLGGMQGLVRVGYYKPKSALNYLQWNI